MYSQKRLVNLFFQYSINHTKALFCTENANFCCLIMKNDFWVDAFSNTITKLGNFDKDIRCCSTKGNKNLQNS
jgi:hypothetical protein